MEPLEIGRGSYGSVFRYWKDSVSPVAVKVIKLGSTGIPSLVELSIMKTYRHPHIGGASEITIGNGEIRIEQELAIGDLYTYIRSGYPIDVKVWSSQIACAVACLHSDRIVHCDIKSDNVVVTREGTLKLIDFSLSLVKHERQQTFSHNIGALGYRAPEVIMKCKWNEKVDIWGLGCVLYEMATRTPLVESLTGEENKEALRAGVLGALARWRFSMGDSVQMQQSTGGLARVASEWSKTGALAGTISSMLNFTPGKRPSISRVIRMLGEWQAGSVRSCAMPPKCSPCEDSLQRVGGYLQGLSYCPLIARLMAKLDALLASDAQCTRIERLDVAYWIAHKLVNNNKPPAADHLFTPASRLLELEVASCAQLEFLLHTLVNEVC